MDANGARWLAGNDNQFQLALTKSIELIKKRASKSQYYVVLPKLSPEATIFVKESLLKSGYTVRVGSTFMKDRGRLVVSW